MNVASHSIKSVIFRNGILAAAIFILLVACAVVKNVTGQTGIGPLPVFKQGPPASISCSKPFQLLIEYSGDSAFIYCTRPIQKSEKVPFAPTAIYKDNAWYCPAPFEVWVDQGAALANKEPFVFCVRNKR